VKDKMLKIRELQRDIFHCQQEIARHKSLVFFWKNNILLIQQEIDRLSGGEGGIRTVPQESKRPKSLSNGDVQKL